MGSELASLIARLKSPLPVCPFDSRSPDYWTTSNDKPCHVCGGTEEVDKCRGADTRCMDEAATALSAQEEQIERYRAALTECGAEWRSPPTTIGRAMEHVSVEFKRRMQIAADALEGSKGNG